MLFTAFPHPDDSANPDVPLRCAASVNEELRVAQQAPSAWLMLIAMRRGLARTTVQGRIGLMAS